jgi:hypothetical protein
MKALVVHTADEAGPAPGPDYVYGWGLMNAARAAQVLNAQAASSNALTHIKQIYLFNGGTVELPVTATGSEPLKVTVCWTDPPGPVSAPGVDANVPALVNDLDVRLLSMMTTHYPWRLDPSSPAAAATASGDNDRDNVEQVIVNAPMPGAPYMVQVTHKGTLVDDNGLPSWQALSLIVSGVVVAPVPELKVVGPVFTGPNAILAWESVVGAGYRISTSTDLEAWTDASGDVSASRTVSGVLVPVSPSDDYRYWRVKRVW